jgi:UDP-glucose 4-epimerase
MSKINFEFFNIGSQKSISILELAQIIIKNSGLNLKPEFKESLQGDAKISLADITLAIKKLQWNPTYKLEKWFEEEVFNK